MPDPQPHLPGGNVRSEGAELLENHAFPELADALRRRTSQIMERWQRFIVEILPAADSLTLAQVRDEIPTTLAKLADALASSSPKQTQVLLGQTTSHGLDRFHNGYNVEELIVEYRILRHVVIEEVELALNRRTSTQEDLVLSMGIDLVLQQGVVTFVNYQQEELRASVEAETKFVAYLSHDLRNQLNHISLVTEVLSSTLGDNPLVADQIAEIDNVRNAIFDTVQGMEQILTATRLRKGKAEINVGPVDLTALAHAVVGRSSREAELKGLKVAVHTPASAHCVSDGRLLSLILHNLLSNAIKYSTRGTVAITVSTDAQGAWSVSVADEGPGIAPDQKDRIFDEFVRGDTHGQSGMGLGLTIAMRAAKLLNADLTVESVLGKGSVFRLSSPAAKATSP